MCRVSFWQQEYRNVILRFKLLFWQSTGTMAVWRRFAILVLLLPPFLLLINISSRPKVKLLEEQPQPRPTNPRSTSTLAPLTEQVRSLTEYFTFWTFWKEKFRELLLRRRERVADVCSSSSAQSSRTQVGTTHLYVLKVSLRREYCSFKGIKNIED